MFTKEVFKFYSFEYYYVVVAKSVT